MTEPHLYDVVITDEALNQLGDLSDYIAHRSYPATARRFTDKVLDHAQGLSTFPHRGEVRADVRPGLRVISYRKRVVIAFTVDDTARPGSLSLSQ